MELTDIEIRALRAMRQFQLAVDSIKESDASAERVRQMKQDELHRPCPGAKPTWNGAVATCPLCGLVVDGSRYASLNTLQHNMEGAHWIHKNGGNPFHRTGLSGKAAMADAGDWYGSH